MVYIGDRGDRAFRAVFHAGTLKYARVLGDQIIGYGGSEDRFEQSVALRNRDVTRSNGSGLVRFACHCRTIGGVTAPSST